MTDAQWLLVIAALIYVSDCLVFLPRDAVAVVIPFRGRPLVRTASSWAGTESGGLAFTALLPPRAVFVCGPAGSFRLREIDKRVDEVLRATRRLHVLGIAAFVALFVIAPLLSWRFGFAQIGLVLIGAFLIVNAIIAVQFHRSHARVRRPDRAHRWAHAIVMLVATPTAIRAADQVCREVLREFDGLAAAARLAGEGHPEVRRMLRELAHPAGGLPPGARYEAAVAAGLRHSEAPPEAAGGASLYCPRCLALYQDGRESCVDCQLALHTLVTSPPVHGPRRRSRT